MDQDFAEKIVRQAERVYRARDVDEACAMYEPDAVIIWNGREVARGEESVRKFHEAFFDPSITDLKLDKKMICASKDTIAVEWRASWGNPDGSRGEQFAAEHWEMRGERLTEWRAFATTKKIS
jgi:nuclear transport factor 2 (NTF2) superfamily protein